MFLITDAAPILVVLLLIATGTMRAAAAAGTGLAIAVAVSCLPGERSLGESDILDCLGLAGWQAFLIGLVLLAGLFFREVTQLRDDRSSATASDAVEWRSAAFTACFLEGPFVECSTGYGVGQVTTSAKLRGLGLAAEHVAMLALFSQCMVSWGAFANGTLVGAELARLPPSALGVRSAVLNTAVLVAWLGAFWRYAATAGLPTGGGHHLAELGWILTTAFLMIPANSLLGPEVAGLATLGFLLALRATLRAWATPRSLVISALRVWPYLALLLALVATRVLPPVRDHLAQAAVIAPWPSSTPWHPLLHPATYLAGTAILAALARGGVADLPGAAAIAWKRARTPIMTILAFLALAQVMARSGSAENLSAALHELLGREAILGVPVMAGLFGYLASSSNGSNGLLMASQVALADAAWVSPAWLAAIQNTAAASLTMLSPARLSMACSLAGREDLERQLLRRAWPLAVLPLAVLLAAAALLLTLDAAQTRSLTGLKAEVSKMSDETGTDGVSREKPCPSWVRGLSIRSYLRPFSQPRRDQPVEIRHATNVIMES